MNKEKGMAQGVRRRWNGYSTFHTPGVAPAKPGPSQSLSTLLHCPLTEITFLRTSPCLEGRCCLSNRAGSSQMPHARGTGTCSLCSHVLTAKAILWQPCKGEGKGDCGENRGHLNTKSQ